MQLEWWWPGWTRLHMQSPGLCECPHLSALSHISLWCELSLWRIAGDVTNLVHGLSPCILESLQCAKL